MTASTLHSVKNLALPVCVGAEHLRAAAARAVRCNALALRERGEPCLQTRRAVKHARPEYQERLEQVEERVLRKTRLVAQA
jgi:hypothetical protein